MVWLEVIASCHFTSTLGAVIGIILIVATKRGKEVPMPFGPFLAIGGIAALFYGQQLAYFYLPS